MFMMKCDWVEIHVSSAGEVARGPSYAWDSAYKYLDPVIVL